MTTKKVVKNTLKSLMQAPNMAVDSNRAELQKALTDMNTAIRGEGSATITVTIQEGFLLYSMNIDQAKAAKVAAEAEKKKPKKVEAVTEGATAEAEEDGE